MCQRYAQPVGLPIYMLVKYFVGSVYGQCRLASARDRSAGSARCGIRED